MILLKINKEDTPSFRSVHSPKLQILSKCFAEIYRAQYGNAMLVHIRCTPKWRPENSVNIWNLHSGHKIAPNTGANVTKFFNQILKISHQIGD